jgi:ComF family protein
LIAEVACILCGTPFVNRHPLDEKGQCALCAGGLPGYNRVHCFGSYTDTLGHLIRLLKYTGIRPLAGRLARHLVSALPYDSRFDVVVPVPLHWRRLWKRGFNQAELLAKGVSKRRRIPMLSALKRVHMRGTQAGLSHQRRRENVRGAFRVQRDVAGLHILLVDDVMTTGATGSACAFALKRAGAKSVTLLTLARVDRRLAAPSARRQTTGASQYGSIDEIAEACIGAER